jgi:oligopeptide/dipeptide ABC transporter ATP-binding protein
MSFLRVEDLRTIFRLSGSFASRLAGRRGASITAVDGVSLVVERGQTYGVIGESGSGKTTLGRSILRLVEPTSGKVMLDGRDILGLRPRDFRPYRRRLQIVFQDPQAALSPAMTVGAAVAHPLVIHGLADREEARRQAGEMLERVGLEPAGRFLNAYPTDLSGGQKQRAVIARALMLGPELVVADEPVSMLDASVRTKILALLLDLQRSLGLTYVFITHDLATARFVCDSIAIMYLGQVIEQGPAREVYAEPRHPYTKALLAAVPQSDPFKRAKKEIPGGVRDLAAGALPVPSALPPGVRSVRLRGQGYRRCAGVEVDRARRGGVRRGADPAGPVAATGPHAGRRARRGLPSGRSGAAPGAAPGGGGAGIPHHPVHNCRARRGGRRAPARAGPRAGRCRRHLGVVPPVSARCAGQVGLW